MYFQVMRILGRRKKPPAEHDGFESDGVGMRAELSEKVSHGVSSEGRKEASECGSVVTTQTEQRVGWPRGQSIPLTFLAPQNADQASRTPWPLLVTVSAIVAGSPSRSEPLWPPVPSTWHRAFGSRSLGQPSETGCLCAENSGWAARHSICRSMGVFPRRKELSFKYPLATYDWWPWSRV